MSTSTSGSSSSDLLDAKSIVHLTQVTSALNTPYTSLCFEWCSLDIVRPRPILLNLVTGLCREEWKVVSANQGRLNDTTRSKVKSARVSAP